LALKDNLEFGPFAGRTVRRSIAAIGGDRRNAAKNRNVIPALNFQNAFWVRRVPRRSTMLVETVSGWYGRPAATVPVST
jgi:hypothetical protein